MKAGKVGAVERKKWQPKGMSLPVETVNSATQADHAVEMVDGETQSKVEIDVLERLMDQKRKTNDRAEDVIMGGSPDSVGPSNEDVSTYEEKDDAPATTPQEPEDR